MEPELGARVRVEAKVSPSESADKVAKAVGSILGTMDGVDALPEYVRFDSREVSSLNHLREQLRDRHVRGAASRMLMRGRQGNRTTIMLNRQAAAVGVVAVCGSPQESPLGPIYLTIRSRDLDSVLKWLAGYEEE